MKISTILFCLFMTTCFSQKQYDFDYVIEYELSVYKDSIQINNPHSIKKDKTYHRYFLTNSKNNEYLAIITEIDSLNYRIMFRDINGISANVIFPKDELNKAEYINIDCHYVIKLLDKYKFLRKHYDFKNLNDTLINNKSFSRYKLITNNNKIEKKQKLGTDFYMIDKSTDFHLPILTSSVALNEWKKEKNIPNGIMSERVIFNYFNQMIHKEKLIKFEKTDKKIIIPKDCNDTEFIIQ